MDPYYVLQVHPQADDETIRAAYRSLLRRYHPDKNPDRIEWAEQATRLLNEAFALVGDPERRRAYDKRSRSSAGGAAGPEPARGERARVSHDASHAEAHAENRRLEQELARLRADNRELRMRLEQASAQVRAREEEARRAEGRLADLDAQRLRLEQALAIARKQSDLLRARNAEGPHPAAAAGSPRAGRNVPRGSDAHVGNADVATPRAITLPGSGQTMRFVWIPPGAFDMGSPVGQPDERPVHRVALDGFWMSISPVTARQFAAFLRANATWSRRVGGVERHPDYLADFHGDTPHSGREQYPVTGVTWFVAAAFCQWLGVALPTEAQWEYAARGGGAREYATSSGALTPNLANYGGHLGGLTPVRHYPPNPFGLYDMSGTVWEWCADEYGADFYATQEACRDNPANGSRLRFRDNDAQQVAMDSRRVIRGGSWRSVSADLRASARANQIASLPSQFCGFRCVIVEE